jgi:hypothetical protein
LRLPPALAAAALLAQLALPARAEVEVVRPIPRAAGGHGFTIEVPTPGAVGSFEVLRGGRLPDPNSPDPGAAAAAPGAGPAVNSPTPPRTIQIAPVRPVEVAPVGLHGRGNTAPVDGASRTVRVQRGPFARPPVAGLPGPDDDAPAASPGLPGGLLGGLLGGLPGGPPGAAAAQGSGPAPGIPPLPPGARVIRIR